MYQVSNTGFIKSLKRKRILSDTILKMSHTHDGYVRVVLCKKYFRVSRLVAQYFVHNPLNLPEVNHKNRNKDNNAWWNLEWVDTRENTCHFIDKSKTTSKATGVYFDKRYNKWKASFSVKGKRTRCGSFDTESEAIEAYKIAVSKNNISNRYAVGLESPCLPPKKDINVEA